MRCISIGIDIGSTIIKVVAWDEKSGMVYSDYVCHHQEVQKPSVIDPEHRFLSKCRSGGAYLLHELTMLNINITAYGISKLPHMRMRASEKAEGLPLLRLPVWVGSFRFSHGNMTAFLLSPFPNECIIG